ncbi:hypothetical protein CENSYa_0395 [Cenarchaeum symbiosum A]|uniref:Uncharacterized protein n=1 Tax=Cenarchaeum symbiosum (strain A) TaxID=414004 RepID=A0RUL4_CENSY|nr:hypothetical protein CENSYa_0395 [Cenarchaeum symbiosum A]
MLIGDPRCRKCRLGGWKWERWHEYTVFDRQRRAGGPYWRILRARDTSLQEIWEISSDSAHVYSPEMVITWRIQRGSESLGSDLC